MSLRPPTENDARPHPTLGDYYSEPDQRSGFVRDIFNRTAGDYNRIERLMALGSGSWYRHRALVRAGLRRNMRVLDVATGTGLTAREAISVTGRPDRIIGLDPSAGMISEARRNLEYQLVLGRAEQLPVADGRFDFLSMGYALRHVSDLDSVFLEYFRVLKPGGRVCLLEITRPRGSLSMRLLKFYMKGLVPVLARVVARHRETAKLMEYYWDTIAACVPPERILEALQRAGFLDVNRHIELGIFSEYVGTKPT